MSTTTQLSDPTRVEPGNGTPERFVQPRFQAFAGEAAHELKVWMPGVPKDGVEVSLADDHLVIVGRRDDQVPDHWRSHFRELADFDYRLRLRLNIRVDSERIEAAVEDGLLTLTLSIQEEAKPRTIEIK